MADDAQSCPSCGARVPEGAEQCDLCGTTVETASDDESPSETGTSDAGSAETAEDLEAEDVSGAPNTADHVYCNQCGLQNPIDANYCSQCGTQLQDLSTRTPDRTRAVTADLPDGASAEQSPDADDSKPETEEQAEMGKQILLMVGVGLVFVLGFFFATQWSQQYEWSEESNGSSPSAEATQSGGPNGAPSSPATGPMTRSGRGSNSSSTAQPQTDLSTLVNELSGSVEGPVADKIDSLRARAENAEGQQQRQLRSELVQLYIGAGAPGRAALLQSQIADAAGTVDARRRTADLLYRWMRQVEQQGDRARIGDVAQHVATAYKEVAEQRPEDLDARTRMGEAYLLTNNPMNGIQAINAVLKDDSTFVPARFQKGLALLQINRLDQAIKQFEMVKQYADEQEPFYKQAERAITVIREQSSSSESEPQAQGE